MNFENFKQEVLERLSKERQFQQLVLKEVKKVNGLTLQGLSIANSLSSPIVYLEELFEDYKKGTGFNSILSNIDSLLNLSIPSEIVLQNICNFNLHKKKIFPQIVNAEGNEDYIKGKAFLPFLNFYILFYIDHSESYSVNVTNQIMNAWDIEIDELLTIAKENIENHYTFFGMNQIRIQVHEDSEYVTFDENNIMYVLSNNNTYRGAGAIVNERILKAIFHDLQEDFYILPSSIHEVIIVRATEYGQAEDLKQMVMAVNTNCVQPKDVLGNDVYMYDGKAQKLFIV